nr:flavodoxin [uncultured Tolumonas sp.]
MNISRYFCGIRGALVLVMTVFLSFYANAEQTSAIHKKILIVYFSQPEKINLQDTDGFSGASVLVKNNNVLGSTQYIAQIIQQQTKGDLFRIETVKDYPTQHDPLVKYAEKEQQANTHPELKAKVQNLADYDRVFIGYPIWWYKMPMALYSFLEQHDLSGKTIIPFSTHGGSRFSGSINEIARLQPNAKIINQGLTISRSDVADDDTEADVIEWLHDISVTK